MTLSPARAPRAADLRATGVRRLTATLYGYAFLDDFVLLYPVYALLFSDTGLSLWQVSSLFALWSITGIRLEVPSGAWADAVSRRLLLWLGPLLTAAHASEHGADRAAALADPQLDRLAVAVGHQGQEGVRPLRRVPGHRVVRFEDYGEVRVASRGRRGSPPDPARLQVVGQPRRRFAHRAGVEGARAFQVARRQPGGDHEDAGP